MRIPVLFIIDTLRDFGGAEKNLSQIVTRIDPSCYEPYVCCLKAGRVFDDLRSRGVKIDNLAINRIYTPSAVLKAVKLIRWIRKNRIQVVVTYFESSDFWGSIVARLAGVPVIFSNRRDMGFALKKRHINAYRFFDRFFDKIITVCDAVKTKIIMEEEVPGEKVVTVYNGVDIEEAVVSPELRLSLGVGEADQLITMVANLAPVKDHQTLLEAARLVVSKHPTAKFLLVGVDKNGYGEHLRALARKLEVSENVIFAGYRRDVAQILAVSDICVLSSTTEGMSNAILEYMAAGKPVVATDVGGNGELVDDGKTGLLIPAGNAHSMASSISLLVENQPLRSEMGFNAKERVKELFSVKNMVDVIEGLIDAELEAKEKGKG